MDQPSRSETTALRINAIMARFPLILDILEELSEAETLSPADESVRRGALSGVDEMIAALAGLPPASAENGSGTSDAEDLASTWLHGQKPRRLLPDETFVTLTRTVARCLPQKIPPRETS